MDINWIKSNFVEEVLDAQSYQTIYIQNIRTLEKSGYELMKLSSVCKSIYRGNTPEHIEGIIPKGALLLKTTNIRSNELDLSKIFCMKEEVYLNEGRFKLNENDICITIMGATNDIVGRSWVYRSNIGPACFSDGIAKIEDVKIDSSFLSTYINSKYGHLSIIQWAGSSTRSYITNKQLGDIKIPIPSPEVQKYIGDKVRRAEGLREEAKKLRKKAESFINGKIGILKTNDDSQYSSAFISSSKIIDRIDSEYYNTKYLRIEKEFDKMGYETKTLNELCNRIFNGKTYSTTNVEGRYFNIGVGELGDWFISKNNEKLINDTINKRYCLNKNSIVWGNAAHLAKYIGEKVNMIFEDDIVIPTTEVTAIEPNEEVIDSYYLYLFMRSKWGYYQIQRTVKGMTAHSYPQDIGKILVPIINLTNEEKEEMKDNVVRSYNNEILAQQLIQEAKQDVEDLIEGNFHMSKLSVTTPESR